MCVESGVFCLARLRRPVVEAAYGHDGRTPGTVEVRGRRYCWCFILGRV